MAAAVSYDSCYASTSSNMMVSSNMSDAMMASSSAASSPAAPQPIVPSLPPSLTLDQSCRAESAFGPTASNYCASNGYGSVSSSASSNSSAGQPRFVVLVVDDNAINRKVLSIPLRKQGIEVVEAENGLLAVEAYAAIRPSLVLMDISMPVMDGFEATRQIRSLEMATAIQQNPLLDPPQRARIVAATTHSSERDFQEGKDAGMDDWLLKPIRPSVLVKDILEFRNLQHHLY